MLVWTDPNYGADPSDPNSGLYQPADPTVWWIVLALLNDQPVGTLSFSGTTPVKLTIGRWNLGSIVHSYAQFLHIVPGCFAIGWAILARSGRFHFQLLWSLGEAQIIRRSLLDRWQSFFWFLPNNGMAPALGTAKASLILREIRMVQTLLILLYMAVPIYRLVRMPISIANMEISRLKMRPISFLFLRPDRQ